MIFENADPGHCGASSAVIVITLKLTAMASVDVFLSSTWLSIKACYQSDVPVSTDQSWQGQAQPEA